MICPDSIVRRRIAYTEQLRTYTCGSSFAAICVEYDALNLFKFPHRMAHVIDGRRGVCRQFCRTAQRQTGIVATGDFQNSLIIGRDDQAIDQFRPTRRLNRPRHQRLAAEQTQVLLDHSFRASACRNDSQYSHRLHELAECLDYLVGQKHLGFFHRFPCISPNMRHDQQIVVTPSIGD
jgi:hypothetical protein